MYFAGAVSYRGRTRQKSGPTARPSRSLGVRPTPVWAFGRSHAAAVKGLHRRPAAVLDHSSCRLETPPLIARATHVTVASNGTFGRVDDLAARLASGNGERGCGVGLSSGSNHIDLSGGRSA